MCDTIKTIYSELIDMHHWGRFSPSEHHSLKKIKSKTREIVMKLISGLNKFLKHCEDFIEPTGIDITIQQIEMVIDIAQRRFGLLDIVAPVNPLVIMRLNNSNRQCNSQCGVLGEGSDTRAILMMFNPRADEGNDPVYIFAHELGHAFHLALTHEAQIMPKKFDEMNESLGMGKNIPIADKIELFADVFAMALLNCPELKEYDPFTEFVHIIPYFDKYIPQRSCKQ